MENAEGFRAQFPLGSAPVLSYKSPALADGKWLHYRKEDFIIVTGRKQEGDFLPEYFVQKEEEAYGKIHYGVRRRNDQQPLYPF